MVMLEVFTDFQKIGESISATVLIAVGAISLVIGLCMWLGGLRWRKPAVAALGAITGAVCISFFADKQTGAIAVTALIGAGLGLFFERPVLVFSGAIMTAMIVLIFFAAGSKSLAGDDGIRIDPDRSETISARSELAKINNEIVIAARRIIRLAGDVPMVPFLISIASGCAVGLCGFFLWRLVAAATLSTFGTALISFGMVFLLMYKNSAPITRISENTSLYGTAALAMIAFGGVVQMLLCPQKRKKVKDDKNDGDEK
jgi:hypothetical protein